MLKNNIITTALLSGLLISGAAALKTDVKAKDKTAVTMILSSDILKTESDVTNK